MSGTLVLVQDREYELRASQRQLVFAHWDQVEARGKRRTLQFSVSLASHHQPAASDVAIPVVVTAPFTPQFSLEAASLLLLLHAEAPPIEFTVTFQPPPEQDRYSLHFQDHVIIQTRLARLTVQLFATHGSSTTEEIRALSFSPHALPTVRAPAFKLFDQIEREGYSPVIASHRVATSSSSFHPASNGEKRLESLPPLPSRPSSSSSATSGRRTASPRLLEPLAPSPPPTESITADVSNQLEAKAVILKLRARRASAQATAVDAVNADLSPSCPESHVDGKAKAELDEFNALVKTAKLDVASERTKAKQELDFYKTMLPPQPVEVVHELVTLLSPIDKQGDRKKPARLPTLAPTASEAPPPSRVAAISDNQSGSNQDLSPVKTLKSKGDSAVSKRVVSTKATIITPSKPPQAAAASKQKPTPAAQPAKLTGKAASVSKPPVSTTKLTKVGKKSTRSAAQSIPMSAIIDAALADFDDSDPEIDDAPVFSDCPSTRQEQEEDEDEFLRLLAR